MAFEQKFFIDHENQVRVAGLNNKTQLPTWKSFYGSIQPMRICIVTPNANALTAPFYTAEDNTNLTLRTALVLIPDPGAQDADLQTSLKIEKSDWVKANSTDWTGSFDLDDLKLKGAVAVKNPISLFFQFDIQVGGASWTTVCQLEAKIYNNVNILN